MRKQTTKYRDKIIRGPVLKTLLSLSLPLIIVQLIQISYNVADAFWLSLYSDIALTVPRQTWPLFLFFSAFSMALSSSNLALISQYIGAKKLDEAEQVASKFFTVSVLSGMFFGSLYLSLRHIIFTNIIAVPSEIYQDVIDFAGIVSIVMAFSYIVTAYSTILQSIGDTLRPAIVNATFLLFNIILDPLFIFGIGPFPKLGVVGAAVTDLIGNILSVITLAIIVRNVLPDMKIRLTRHIGIDWVLLNIKIGLPILVLILSNSMAKMLQLRLVNTFGIVVATAYSFGFIAIDISDATLRGLARGTAIMIGQNLGAKLSNRAREIALKSSLTAFASTLVGASVVYIFMDQFISIFIQDPAIFLEAKKLLEIILLSLPFFGMLLVALFVGRGSGHTMPPTLIGMTRLWVFWVCLGYLLGIQLGMGSTGIWMAMSIGNIVTGLMALAWIKYGGWTRPVIGKRLKI